MQVKKGLTGLEWIIWFLSIGALQSNELRIKVRANSSKKLKSRKANNWDGRADTLNAL